MAFVSTTTVQTPVTRSFVVTREADTLATERVSRAADRVDSDLLDTTQGLRIALTMMLAPDAHGTHGDRERW
ncbi:MAG TPA: hypothetical protein VLI43_15410 [Gemmatimonadaceae bacterium]|nr:hypothetical protein [Gemmatimonadaceae bacterium]